MSEKDPKPANKFASILQARTTEPTEPGNDFPVPAAPTAPRGRGRPATGKRSNPDYEQVSIYIRKDTHSAAKIKLLKDRDPRDLSEVVEELLADWLES